MGADLLSTLEVNSSSKPTGTLPLQLPTTLHRIRIVDISPLEGCLRTVKVRPTPRKLFTPQARLSAALVSLHATAAAVRSLSAVPIKILFKSMHCSRQASTRCRGSARVHELSLIHI